MALIQNQKLLLPLKGTKSIRDVMYYVVEHDHVEYYVRMFPFQLDKPVPQMLDCWVKDAEKGEIVQDRVKLLSLLYKIGEVHKFRIRNDFTHSHPSYYEVIDTNGIKTRLYNYGKRTFKVNEYVDCKIAAIGDNGYLTVEVVDDSLDRVGDLKLQSSSMDADVSDSSYEIDLKTASQYFQHIISWLGRETFDGFNDAVDTYCSFCESMIEKSYASNIKQEQVNQTISRKLLSIECLREAIGIFTDGTASDYIQTVLSKLSNKYFYKKEERILTAFFILGNCIGENNSFDFDDLHKLVDSGMVFIQDDKDIFSVLARCKTNDDIDDTAVDSKQLANLGTDDLKSMMLQLLLDGTDARQDQLCHFLIALLPYSGAFKDKLLTIAIDYELAGLVLTNVLTWQDLQELNFQLIAGKFANAPYGSSSDIKALFKGNGFIEISSGKIRVSALSCDESLKEVYCSLGLLTDKIQILSSDKLRIDDNRVQDMLLAWNLVCLESEKKTTGIVDRSGLLVEGSEVTIRLDSFSVDDYCFQCTVMDGAERVHGVLPVDNMVRYRVSQADLLLQGDEPVYIPATVLECNPDTPVFSCAAQLQDCVYDIASVGLEVPCKLKSSNPNKGGSAWLAQPGFNVYTDCVDLPVKSICMLRINSISTNGYIRGELVSNSGVFFYDNEAFCNLVDQIRVDVEQDADDPRQEPVCRLHIGQIRNLMHLITEKAGVASNFYEKLNILCVLRLMARIIGDDSMSLYYKERIRQLGLLRSYLDNGHVDMDVFLDISEDKSILYQNYPSLRETAEVLSVLSYMNDKDGNEKLIDLYQGSSDSQAGKLSGLILACNILDEYDLKVDKAVIRQEVVRLLNMSLPDADKSDILVIGSEDYHTEFKTSIVFPAGNSMFPDVQTQSRVIASVVAGFLNADGGTLYIGVNNYGVPVGVSSDLDFLGDKDKFEVALHNTIRYELGKDINSVLSTRWCDYQGKDVYVIDVPAYHQLVVFQTGSIVYCRQQSSTIQLDKKAADLQAERKRLRFGDKIAMPVIPVPEAPVETDIEVKLLEQQSAKAPIKRPSASSVYMPFYCPTDMFDYDFSIYLNYLTSDEYMISDHSLGNREVCLSVPFEDGDKLLVQLFNNGNIACTSLKQIIGKKRMYPYKLRNFRYTDLAGVAIASPHSKLFISVSTEGKIYGRVIDLDTVQVVKDICTMGKPYSNIPFDRFTACVQVPDYYVEKLSRITDSRITNNGFLLSAETYRKEVEFLKAFVPFGSLYLE